MGLQEQCATVMTVRKDSLGSTHDVSFLLSYLGEIMMLLLVLTSYILAVLSVAIDLHLLLPVLRC